MRKRIRIFLWENAITLYMVFVSLCTLACLLSCTGMVHIVSPDPFLTWAFFCFGGGTAVTFVASVYRKGTK